MQHLTSLCFKTYLPAHRFNIVNTHIHRRRLLPENAAQEQRGLVSLDGAQRQHRLSAQSNELAKLFRQFRGFWYINRRNIRRKLEAKEGSVTLFLIHAATVATLISFVWDLSSGAGTAVTWGQLIGDCSAFFILSFVFVDDGEYATVVTYSVGLLGCWALLAQSFLAGLTPRLLFGLVSTLVAASVVFNSARAAGHFADRAWATWRFIGRCIGYLLVSQTAFQLTMHYCYPEMARSAITSWIAGSGCALMALATERAFPNVQSAAAWCATLTFMLNAVHNTLQVVCLSSDPLSVTREPSILLAVCLSTSLQVPRAIFTGINMWRLGTTWSSAFAAIQLAIVDMRGTGWGGALLSGGIGAYLLLIQFWAPRNWNKSGQWE